MVRKLCSSARGNSNNKEQTSALPQLMINQPTDPEKEKYYNSTATQTTVLEEKEESIADDMEIISNNVLQDDFVQLDFNECNEQQDKVCSILSLMTINFLFFRSANSESTFFPEEIEQCQLTVLLY